MKRTFFLAMFLVALAASLMAIPPFAQQRAIEPDLTKLVEGKGWRVLNRQATPLEEVGKKGVRFDERVGVGLAILENAHFVNGAIEFDVRGKDILQRSFVGVAFHGVDEKTYDAVYFRPFNFRNADPVRRSHAVQYISHPADTWEKLRQEHPGMYEKPLEPAPEAEAWFHVRIVVAKPKVSVFVNNAKEPSLVVEQLSDRAGGWIAFWMGTNSSGDFANLKIIPAK